MGEHTALMATEWGIGREEQDELAARSHRNLAAAYDTGFLDDLVTPFLGLERDQNLRPDSSPEKLAKLRPVFGGPDGTMTAGNSTPLSDGASSVLLASEEWAAAHDIPVQAYFTEAQTAGVDYVNGGEGLLMAPAYAMPRMLDRAGADAAGLRLLRDPRGVRRAGAVHAEGLGGPGVLPRAPGPWSSHWARSTAPSSTSTAGRSAPVTHSARLAGGSWPTWPRPWPRRVPGEASSPSAPLAASVSPRSWRPQMSDRYQQLINTPIGRVVSKQVGLPQPVKLERYEPGQPVIDGPVLFGAAPGGRLSGPVMAVLAAIGAEVHTPMQDDVRTAAAISRP